MELQWECWWHKRNKFSLILIKIIASDSRKEIDTFLLHSWTFYAVYFASVNKTSMEVTFCVFFNSRWKISFSKYLILINKILIPDLELSIIREKMYTSKNKQDNSRIITQELSSLSLEIFKWFPRKSIQISIKLVSEQCFY